MRRRKKNRAEIAAVADDSEHEKDDSNYAVQKRMETNRLRARDMRKKKKKMIEEMNTKIVNLTIENQQLKNLCSSQKSEIQSLRQILMSQSSNNLNNNLAMQGLVGNLQNLVQVPQLGNSNAYFDLLSSQALQQTAALLSNQLMSTMPSSIQQQSHQSSAMSAGAGGNQRQDAGIGQGDNIAKTDASSTIFEQGDKSNTTFTNADLFRNPVLFQALLQGGGLVGGVSSERQQSVNTTAQQDNSNTTMLRQFVPASNKTDSAQPQQSSNPTMQLLQQLPQEFLASALNATGSENNVNTSTQQSMIGGAPDGLQKSGAMTNLINNNMIQGGGFSQQQQDQTSNNNIQQQQQQQQVQNFQQQQDTNMSNTS